MVRSGVFTKERMTRPQVPRTSLPLSLPTWNNLQTFPDVEVHASGERCRGPSAVAAPLIYSEQASGLSSPGHLAKPYDNLSPYVGCSIRSFVSRLSFL